MLFYYYDRHFADKIADDRQRGTEQNWHWFFFMCLFSFHNLQGDALFFALLFTLSGLFFS